MNKQKKITIIIGHYGSGKTEFAVNYALANRCAALVDLDIVNPYFRSSDLSEMLEQRGVRVISPRFAGTNVDVPSLTADIFSAFECDGDVVFDVGGDDDGAIVLGRFNQYFMQRPYEMLMVINTNRPLTADAESIKEYMAAIETVSRLKISGIVNNTNVMNETTLDNLLAGQKIIERVGVPVRHISGAKDIVNILPSEYKQFAFPLDIYLKKPWE